jgi:hypothetical protein
MLTELNASSLFAGLLISSIGMGYFIYGKKQRATVPLVCGIGMMAFPYFVTSVTLMLLIGALLMLAAYFIRI